MFELGKFLPFRLTVLSSRLTRRVALLYGKRFKLTAPEWRTLAVLGQHGPMTANAVIVQTTMDKVRVSRAVAKLLNAKLITRDSDPLDRRRAILALTETGRSVFAQIVPLVQDVEADIIAAMTVEERAILDGALNKIESYLARVGELAADESEEEE